MSPLNIVFAAAALGVASATCTSNGTIPSSGADCACSSLAAQYGDSLLYPSAANYTEERTDYWDIRSDLLPACIFIPNDADEVANAVSVFSTCDAQFAIRGGGHMNFPGSNNIDGGVLVALERLNDIQVDEESLTFEAGPGNRWVDVYAALDPYGLYAIGGRLKTIGVPGLSLIGGFHYLINKYGFVMDNVVKYDVVLGNGTQVVASNTTNRDLFWALKGGANNFGVVTKFTFKAYPIPKISTTIQQFNESAVPAYLKAATDLVKYDNPDLAAGQVLSIQYNATTKVVSASLLGVQEGTESPPSTFANFTAIPAVARINNVTAPIAWHSQLESPNQMFRVQFAHKTMLPDADQLYNIYKVWKDAVDDIADVEGLYPTFVLNTIPRSAATVGKTNGIGNVWGLDDTDSLLIWQFSTGWALAKDDLRMTNWAQKTADYLHSVNQEKGLANEFVYMGDAGEFQDPYIGFPLENVERMRSIRSEYDPQGVFTRLNWGGFKLGN